MTYSDSLLAAYHKMESVEFYAELLYKARQLGGPKEFTKEQVEQLYEIRRKFGMTGKHPANLCPNAKDGKSSCHSCNGSCGGSHSHAHGNEDAELIAQITKKVMAQLGK